MLKMSRTKMAVTIAGLAAAAPLALGVSAGTAAAQPDYGPIVNTTCTYDQVIRALNDQRPDLAGQFAGQPAGQAALRNFLASPPAQRQATVTMLQGNPTARAYFGPIMQIAGSCNQY